MSEWIRVTPETMPPDMEPIIVSVKYWSGLSSVWNGQVRYNKSAGRYEAWMSDGYASGWVFGVINGNITHWMPWPDLQKE